MLTHTTGTSKQDENNKSGNSQVSLPSLSLPKGGGAIRGIGEKFAANPVTGTGSLTVPIATSPGRSGFGPQLTLSYDSGAGNGPFGFGWNLSLPSITRKTDKGLPQYADAEESDIFILSGAEDLVPLLGENSGQWMRDDTSRAVYGKRYGIHRYRPRVEGLFARIERWVNLSDPQDTFWRSISKDNVTTWYGKTAESRVADPADPSHIFTWLICESYDDKGNVIFYQYKPENSDGVDLSQAHERNRSDASRSAHRYLKHVFYGNRTPYFPDPTANAPVPLPDDWCFELVFDYGEHDENAPLSQETGQPWDCRGDPFSSYRATFEVRTYRLCRRVLMFHHFASEPTVGLNCLVRSTDFTHAQPAQPPLDPTRPFYSFLLSVTQTGYKRNVDGGYLSNALPPLEFAYTEAVIDETVREIDPQSLENLPYGLDGTYYQWADLDGEGLSGILTEQADSWFYKPNLSPFNLHTENGVQSTLVQFGPAETVARKPSLAALQSGRQQLLDLAGDGHLDLVQFDGPTPGYFERTEEEGWAPFTPFTSLPELDWQNPNLKFVDVTGDGHADLLISEDDAFCWYSSLAAAGFGPAQRVQQALDEEKGPKLIFTDGTESIFLADVSGDGLTDLVRIRNGEVCYWPNLGYGRFGAKVTMDQALWFEAPDLFDGRRIRLADIDGSGTTDILYFASGGVHLYFNQSGNAWGERRVLSQFPPVESVSSATALDLLGNGTACLVWSSPLPGNIRQPMRYVDLMGGQKPHLLTRVTNNLGTETRVQYAPSTRFYVADKLAGTPWLTRIPFPVHVVERVDTYDYVSRNRFVTRYSYHHGFYDGVEREFRGFGRVDQWDTEEFATLTDSGTFPQATNFDISSHVPPVWTRTWFHTGAYFGEEGVSKHLEQEYYREGGQSDAIAGLTDPQLEAVLLDDTVLPSTIWLPDGSRVQYNLSAAELREGCRALRGSILRQEIYALDGSDASDRPYSASERNYTIEVLQPQDPNRYAAFFTHARETISYLYERNPADPRISHALTLEVDPYGNVLKSLAIAYGRRTTSTDPALTTAGKAKQSRLQITYTENGFTNAVLTADHYRTPLPAETRTYELTGFKPENNAERFSFDEWTRNGFALLIATAEIPYEQTADDITQQKRLIEHVRTLYRPDDLGTARNDPLTLLVLGTVQPLSLPGESYKLAFTPGLLTQVFQRNGQPLLPNHGDVLPVDKSSNVAADRGGYVDLDNNDHWWIPAGRIFLSPNSNDTAAQELAHARQHFFLPHRTRDPFHTDAVSTESFLTYDAYDLLMLESLDQLGNRITVGERLPNGNIDPTKPGNDYRVLQPWRVMDPNRNRTQVAFDTLGMVVATAVMGKPEEKLGDSLDGFVADLTEAIILDHLQNPLADPLAILGHATKRLVHDLFAYQRTKNQPNPRPAVVYTLARETHNADLGSGQQPRIQNSFSYSDGFGREIQKKIQAEPGPLVEGGPTVSPRWVGSGWTIFNNKGKPVRQYEPFFDDTHQFKFDYAVGVSAILFYDPVERVVATLHPNHTWEKVVFDPWRKETWDVNDTVTLEPQNDKDVKGFFLNPDATPRLPVSDYLPTWYSQRQDGAMDPLEKAAALKAAIHAETPTVAHLDSLGRTFLTVVHNRFKDSETSPADSPTEEFYRTQFLFDLEGNLREVSDAKDRVVMRYDYDVLGNRTHQASMEAGERWTLNDVAGKPIYIWDSRNHQFRTVYDPLRRPTESFLREGASAKLLVGRTVYGENQPSPEANNLRTKMIQLFDQAGVVMTDEYDFKGNLLRSQRQLAQTYKTTLDWATAVPLEANTYISHTRYDALNRPIELTDPDNSVIRPGYNEANLLDRIEANLRGVQQNGQPVWTPFVTNIDYDAKGQRMLIDYSNGVRTTYEYDPLTFRLMHLLTLRNAVAFPDDCPEPPLAGWPGCQMQNLHYTYDPAGNITHIRDDAQQILYFRNKRVEPSADYTYDAIYRLIEATGREHLGQIGATPSPSSYNDKPRVGILFSASDGNAMGRYIERYVYDAVGNFQEMIHRGSDPVNPGWTRAYAYSEPSLLESGKRSNRLSSTTIGATTETYGVGGNGYDLHGNMLHMPQLQVIQWDFQERLQMTQRQAVSAADDEGVQHQGERTWYVYDASGQRIRKVTELASGQVKDERIYLGGFEIYRRQGANPFVRETLHIMDDKQSISLVETRTQGNEPGVPAQLVRYQFGNHLGSAILELDDHAQIISYEEYTPYGSTSYQAVRSRTESPKRYRYTGMERDEETGLAYHSARYYMPWLGRWCSPDPSGIRDTVNLYQYVSGNPMKLVDLSGSRAWERFLGGLKAVGGAIETAAGVALVAAGAATSEIGIGIPIAAAGVFVTAHGADTIVSGARTAWSGEEVDTFTSRGLQAAGMSRTGANLTDAGIGFVGTFGASALAKAPTFLGAAVEAAPAAARALPVAVEAAPAAARALPAAAEAAPAAARALPAAAEAAPAAAEAAPRAAAATPRAAAAARSAAPQAFGASARLLRAQAIVNEAAKASGIQVGRYVDDIRYAANSTSFFEVTAAGRRILTIGSQAFGRTRAGQILEAAHELVHAQQYALALQRAGGNVANAVRAFNAAKFGTVAYAADEVMAESLALRRIATYMHLSPQQIAAATRYIKGWSAAPLPLP